MALGRRREERQQAFWVSAETVSGPRDVFYDRLNQLLAEIEFDRQLEAAC